MKAILAVAISLIVLGGIANARSPSDSSSTREPHSSHERMPATEFRTSPCKSADCFNNAQSTIDIGGRSDDGSDTCVRWINTIQSRYDQVKWEENHDQRPDVLNDLSRNVGATIQTAVATYPNLAVYECRYAGPNSDFDNACTSFHHLIGIERKLRMTGLHLGEWGASAETCEIETTEHNLDRRAVLHLKTDLDEVGYSGEEPIFFSDRSPSTGVEHLNFYMRTGPGGASVNDSMRARVNVPYAILLSCSMPTLARSGLHRMGV